ncbi:MAG: RNase H family protein, partial [Mariprofundaceae bacterium]|nr:RNase H family protein [Mariprofundaceae bacterium]
MGHSKHAETAIEAFTDGACSGNPGPGGWGVWLRYGKHEKELCGGEPHSTNQRMELQAAIEALKALKKPSKITIYSDSKYVVQGITEWISGWK